MGMRRARSIPRPLTSRPEAHAFGTIRSRDVDRTRTSRGDNIQGYCLLHGSRTEHHPWMDRLAQEGLTAPSMDVSDWYERDTAPVHGSNRTGSLPLRRPRGGSTPLSSWSLHLPWMSCRCLSGAGKPSTDVVPLPERVQRPIHGRCTSPFTRVRSLRPRCARATSGRASRNRPRTRRGRPTGNGRRSTRVRIRR